MSIIDITMKRKIVKQGGTALTITLPLAWAKRNNLSAGDEVDVEEKERSLMINADSTASSGSLIIDIPKGYPFYKRIIDTPYRNGYNEIRVNFEDSTHLEKIEAETANLMGFEIVNQGKNFCILKNVAAGIDSEFDILLNRLMLLTKTMMEDLLNSLEKEDFELDNIANMEKITNRLCHFCKRMLNIKGYKEDAKAKGIYRIVSLYEEVADELRDLCKFEKENRIKLSKETIEGYKKIIHYLDFYYTLFHKFSHDKAFELAALEKKYSKEVSKLLVEKTNKESVVIHYLMSIHNHIKHMSDELF